MIHGVTSDAERITMVNARRVSTPQRTKRYATNQPSEWVCYTILEGYPYVHNNPALDQMTVAFYGQNRWAQLSTVNRNQNQADPVKWQVGDSLEMVYEQEPSLKTMVEDTAVELTASINSNMKVYREASMHVKHKFRIDPRCPRVPLSHFWDHLDQLQDLVTFGIGRPTYPRFIEGAIADPPERSTKVNIYRPISNIPEDASAHPNRMLFSGQDLAIQYDHVIGQWYKKSEDFVMII